MPGDSYNRGNDPSAPATVSAFSLDKFEVTVGRFRKYVAQYSPTATPEGAGKNPKNPESFGWKAAWNASLAQDIDSLKTQLNCTNGTWTFQPGANEGKPISCVSWFDAFAFCVWDGARLPTEAEWNFAAAGGKQQRVYPWSQPASSTTIDASYAVYDATGPLNVGSKAAHPSLWGHADLSGNIGEWVKDFDGPYPVPCADCENVGLGAVDPHIYRGGSWQHPAGSVTTTYRAFTTASAATGIRCARDLDD
jgi:formylglycine-generating enzyme required for sulfatase activity